MRHPPRGAGSPAPRRRASCPPRAGAQTPARAAPARAGPVPPTARQPRAGRAQAARGRGGRAARATCCDVARYVGSGSTPAARGGGAARARRLEVGAMARVSTACTLREGARRLTVSGGTRRPRRSECRGSDSIGLCAVDAARSNGASSSKRRGVLLACGLALVPGSLRAPPPAQALEGDDTQEDQDEVRTAMRMPPRVSLACFQLLTRASALPRSGSRLWQTTRGASKCSCRPSRRAGRRIASRAQPSTSPMARSSAQTQVRRAAPADGAIVMS